MKVELSPLPTLEEYLQHHEDLLNTAAFLHYSLHQLSERDQEFATSLLNALADTNQLSPKQAYWLNELANRLRKSEPIYGSFDAVLVMFRLAGQKLKRPKVRLLSKPDADGQETYFELWFPIPEDGTSQRELKIYIGGWQHHGRRRFGGWVKSDRLIPYRDRLTDSIRLTIQDFALDPQGCAKAMAKRLGCCMFCGARLTDDESKDRGYGPVCAENYGQPWGNLEQKRARRAENAKSLLNNLSAGERAEMLKLLGDTPQ